MRTNIDESTFSDLNKVSDWVLTVQSRLTHTFQPTHINIFPIMPNLYLLVVSNDFSVLV